MKVCMMIKNQAGMIGLLTVYKDNKILSVVCYDDLTVKICKQLNLLYFYTIYDKDFIKALGKSDLLISVHGDEIVSEELLELPSIGCINVHPCLSKYKGNHPIERLLINKDKTASVGCHWMNNKVDDGRIIYEEFVDIQNCNNIQEVYNCLYPVYFSVISKSLLSPEINGIWGDITFFAGGIIWI